MVFIDLRHDYGIGREKDGWTYKESYKDKIIRDRLIGPILVSEKDAPALLQVVTPSILLP